MAKVRNDTIEGKKRFPEPVCELNEVALSYFRGYLSCRASFDWSKGDIIRLTKLA